MSLYDITGKKVKDLLSDNLDAGYHSYNLNAKDPSFWDSGLAVISSMIDELEKMEGRNT